MPRSRSRSTLFLALTFLLIGCAATPPTLTPRAAQAPAQEAPSPITTTTMATAPHTPITQAFPRVITPTPPPTATPPPILAPVPAQAHHPTAPREERVLAQHALSDRPAVSPLRTSLDTGAPLLDDIFFDFDSFTLRPDAVATIKTNLRWLEAHPTTTVVLEGHCDERGSREYNLALGQQRADATVDYLVKAGLSPRRLWTLSYGKELPFALDHNEAAWQLNRRTHFRSGDAPGASRSSSNP